jgi:hypothetical protein
MKKIYLISIMLLSICLTGCNSDDKKIDAPIDIYNSNVLFTAAGGTCTFTVTAAEADLQVTTDKNWVTATKSGNTITVTATPNYVATGRTAKVIITAGDNTTYVPVIQMPLLLNVANAVTVDAKGEVLLVAYESSVTPTVQCDSAWLTASVADGKIVLTAQPNPSMTTTRSATVSLFDGFDTIAVFQGTNYLDIDAYDVLLEARGDSVRIGYDDTNPVTLALEPSGTTWLRASLDGDKIVLVAGDNPDFTASRSAEVRVYVLDSYTTINVTQEKNKYLYEDYLGEYTMKWNQSGTNAANAAYYTLDVELVEKVPGESYYLKGLFKPEWEAIPLNIVFTYNAAKEAIELRQQIVGQYTPVAEVRELRMFISLNAGNSYSNSTAFNGISSGMTFNSGKLEFNLLDGGNTPGNIFCGFQFRDYALDGTGGGNATPGIVVPPNIGSTNSNGRYYFWPSFVHK